MRRGRTSSLVFFWIFVSLTLFNIGAGIWAMVNDLPPINFIVALMTTYFAYDSWRRYYRPYPWEVSSR